MKIAFLTLGCKLNYAETSTYERAFKACGMEVVPSTHVADVYLVNTCSVTQHSESKCRHMISKCHRQAPPRRKASQCQGRWKASPECLWPISRP